MSRLTTVICILILALITTDTHAQWGLGASYEVRDKSPKEGFGFRLERDLNIGFPIIDFSFRGHFNFFNEENSLTLSDENKSLQVGREVKSYDYGLTFLGDISLGIVVPYVGIGAGATTTNLNFGDEIKNLDLPDDKLNGDSESEFSYYGILGGEVPLIPAIRPFIEYRFTNYNGNVSVSGVQDNIEASNGRTVFGVILRF